MNDTLMEILRKLRPTGRYGFEQLTADLLSNLTHQPFHLAQSGSQAGRDMSSRHPAANIIAIECKRYDSNTKLDKRELQGEIVEATDAIPDLDVWVLVATRDVSSQIREALQHATQDRGVELLVIADGDTLPSSLAVLCAQAPAIVIAAVQHHIPEDVPQVQALLAHIAAAPDYEAHRASLVNALTTPLLGYDNWRAAQNQWLMQSFRSAAESHAHFGQLLNIGQKGIHLIERRNAWQQLDSWLDAWNDDRRSLVVRGEEGDGKTWAVASWVQRTITHDPQCPPVIFVSSAELQTNEPFDILVHAVAQCMGGMSGEQVRKRVARWVQKNIGDVPLFVLVLDGINERPDVPWWRGLLEKLNVKPWSNVLAVVTTCRTGYWSHFASLRSIKACSFVLPPYDDRELDAALVKHRLSRADIDAELLPLACKPRYFDLLVQHRQRLAESGDVTVARLIYEDWRDRLQRKRHITLADSDFQQILRDLATKYIGGTQDVRAREMMEALPFGTAQMLEELRTSGVFQEHHGVFRVQPNHLVFSLAFLLVEQVDEAVRDGISVPETIARWLEPHTAMDMKAQICEAAALRALEMLDLPTAAKAALLHAWITSQNSGHHTETHLSAYFPVDPQGYFALAEMLWSDAFDHAWGQKLLMRTFRRWIMQANEASLLLWKDRFEHWLGFVHRLYYPYLGEPTDEEAQSIPQAMAERLGAELTPGPVLFADYHLSVIDDEGLMRLGRAALALISHAPREPFIHALATCCVAEAIMDHPNRYDEVAWIIRTSQRPLWDAVQVEVEQLLHAANHITYQAAYRLLACVGNVESHQVQAGLPDDLFPTRTLVQKHKNDPCVSGFSWRRDDCERCVARTDIDPSWLARQIKPYCLDPDLSVPDDIGERLAPLAATIDVQSMHIALFRTSADHLFDEYEAALCAYAPDALAEVVRRFVRTSTEREGMALRQLSFFPQKHSLILTEEEHSALYQAWTHLHETGNFTDETAKTAEMFLFPEILKQLNAEEQLSLLLNRPEHMKDRVVFERTFQPITIWEPVWQQLTTTADTTTVTRILWFLSAHATAIPQNDITTQIVPFLNHDQSLVRALALYILCTAQAEDAFAQIVRGSWARDMSYHTDENHWGSRILCEHGLQLPFSEIMRRVHPLYLGYAVQCRGNISDEVRAYAEMLHQQWLLLGIDAPALPPDVPPLYLEGASTDGAGIDRYHEGLAGNDNRESIIFSESSESWGGDVEAEMPDMLEPSVENVLQRQRENFERVHEAKRQQAAAGNLWFGRHFYEHALDQVFHVRPDVIDQWLVNAVSNAPDAVRRLQVGSTFYETLCKSLLQADPERGLMLYWHLQTVPMYVFTRDRNSHVVLLDYALFSAPPIEVVQQAWQQKLEQATTDQELLNIVIAAQAGTAQDWLRSYIIQSLQADAPITTMRAITLLGFVDDATSRERLTELVQHVPDTWIRVLVNTSLERWQRNAWAKHWFRRFITIEDDVYAWAAFRLFLRCIDRRFWLWQSHILNEIGRDALLSNRMGFLSDNEEEIEKSAKKNEDDLEKQFLGHKIKDGQLWPWMR